MIFGEHKNRRHHSMKSDVKSKEKRVEETDDEYLSESSDPCRTAKGGKRPEGPFIFSCLYKRRLSAAVCKKADRKIL